MSIGSQQSSLGFPRSPFGVPRTQCHIQGPSVTYIHILLYYIQGLGPGGLGPGGLGPGSGGQDVIDFHWFLIWFYWFWLIWSFKKSCIFLDMSYFSVLFVFLLYWWNCWTSGPENPRKTYEAFYKKHWFSTIFSHWFQWISMISGGPFYINSF